MSTVGTTSPPVLSSDEERNSSSSSPNTILTDDSSTIIPPTLDDISRWQCHIDLETFGRGLNAAAKAVFPNTSRTRYKKISVLLLCWEDEDPKLPVSIEIEKLNDVFENNYGFDTEVWRIPGQNSHAKLNQKILNLIDTDDDPKDHLFIVYYGGHARLTHDRLLSWTSWRVNHDKKFPTVQWSGIQNVLEQAESDVLILLDCCHSATATTSAGNGVTEMISACAYNVIANGVGYYSFTNELTIELRDLANRPSFPVADLFRNIFSRIQARRPEDGKERHPAPVHFSLTQDNPQFPRSIQLSVRPGHIDKTKVLNGDSRICIQSGEPNSGHSFENSREPTLSTQAPRILLALRLRDDCRSGELSIDRFKDWLKDMPAVAEEVKIEAGYASFSSILIISIPISLSLFIPQDPAIIKIGPVTSQNLLNESRSIQRKAQREWKPVSLPPIQNIIRSILQPAFPAFSQLSQGWVIRRNWYLLFSELCSVRYQCILLAEAVRPIFKIAVDLTSGCGIIKITVITVSLLLVIAIILGLKHDYTSKICRPLAEIAGFWIRRTQKLLSSLNDYITSNKIPILEAPSSPDSSLDPDEDFGNADCDAKKLRSSLVEVFPQFPASLNSVPMPVLYEVMRVFLHTGVSMSELIFPASLDCKDYNCLWQFLEAHPALRGKVFPTRCGEDVWAASLNGFLCRSRGVVLSGSLSFSTEGSSLFQFRLEPMQLDRQHRLGRRLGNDRFLEIDMPQLKGRHIPSVMENLGEECRAMVIEWLVDSNHSLFGRIWKPFFVKPKKEIQHRKPKGDFPDNGGPGYLVYFFAVDGPGFADFSNHIPPLGAKDFKFDIPRLLNLIRPTGENTTESFLKLFARTPLALSRNTATVLLEQSQIHEKEDLTFGPTNEVMTNGAGRISLALALKVSAHLNLGYLPSGYQGRIGSAKGFWMVNFDDKSGEEWIETYQSQRKWKQSTKKNGESDDPSHRTFEVLAFSGPLKSADLNTQLLPILMNRAVDKQQMKDTISKLLEQSLAEELKSLQSAMDSPKLLRKWIHENISGTSERLNLGAVPYRAGLPTSIGETLNLMLDGGFEPNSLLFMKEMARTVFRSKCDELKTRLNITVGKSAYAYMVPDFLGVLEPNEVYIDFSNFTDDVSGFLGALLQNGDSILLARVPAHLPSDIQKVKFVAKAEYIGLKDVIVCPIKGNPSLASKLSRGDYDGDIAWITWESSIVENFTNASVPLLRDFVKEGYIHEDRRTYGKLVEGQANPESVFLKESCSFAMRPTLLGTCTNWMENLLTVVRLDSQEAVNLSTLLRNLVDQDKSGFIFEEEDWTRFRTEVIQKKLKPPGYRRDDLEGSIKDHLIRVAETLAEASKTDLHESIDDPPSWDEDLVLFYSWAQDKALQNLEYKTILDQLDEELEALKTRWSAYWQVKPKTDLNDETRGEFYSILDECFEKYSAIRPRIDMPLAQLLLPNCLPNSELSHWSMLKASALFASYGPKNGTKGVARFAWLMAGKQLIMLKAYFRSEGGFPNTIVPEMYAILRPDATFLRLRGENGEDLIEKKIRIQREELLFGNRRQSYSSIRYLVDQCPAV